MEKLDKRGNEVYFFDPEKIGFEKVIIAGAFTSYRKDFISIRNAPFNPNVFYFRFWDKSQAIPFEIKNHAFGIQLVESILKGSFVFKNVE